MDLESFERKPYPVRAVQVTDENIRDVANWCGGEVEYDNPVTDSPEDKCINMGPDTGWRLAYVGHWVVDYGGIKIAHTNEAFEKRFVRLSENE